MNLQTLALQKGKQVLGHNIQTWAKHGRCGTLQDIEGHRYYGTKKELSSQLKEELAKEHVKDLANKQRAKKEARAEDKDFFASVLGSSATKREARSYLQRFTPPKGALSPIEQKPQPFGGNGVNLGGLYGPTAVQQSPKFVQHPGKSTSSAGSTQMHIALVKLRAPQTLTDETLNGIGRTLSQLGRLGLISVVVVDCYNKNEPETEDNYGPNWKSLETEQANRVIAAIDAHGENGARLVDNVIGIREQATGYGNSKTRAYVNIRKLLMTPLRRGVIPVIPAIGYADLSQMAVSISASDVILALTKEFAGIPAATLPDEDPNEVRTRLQALRDEVSLDRLILLDPLGGIPTSDRPNGYHVFLNMEQEFEPAKQDLLKTLHNGQDRNLATESIGKPTSDLSSSNPFSKFVETELGGPTLSSQSSTELASYDNPKGEYNIHLQNLSLVRSILSILPRNSSALLTTPEEAANSGRDHEFQAARVGTRRQRNPLIHNLLTDKPVYSSSLPTSRLAASLSHSHTQSIVPTTFAKHGMSVTMFPDPKISPWKPPMPGQPHLTLTDSQIDLPRLVHLIEDSFGRKLDVPAYLSRVNGRIAGVIIAGEYEGGALLTWELPPGVPDDGSSESLSRMVPYLDKFAVLKRSQGSGGVADLIFKAMVRTCFPEGVVWRSRKENPVNKWYFERSRGTWKLPGEGWTMFWTTPDVIIDRQKFKDYEGVCRGIQPSWADNKTLLD